MPRVLKQFFFNHFYITTLTYTYALTLLLCNPIAHRITLPNFESNNFPYIKCTIILLFTNK